MAKTLSDREKGRLIAEHKTGEFSQRALAKKYRMSVGYVNKLTKGIEKDSIEIIDAGVAYSVGLMKSDEQTMNAIERVVHEKTKNLQIIHNMTKIGLKGLSESLKAGTKEIPTKMGVQKVGLSPADYKAGLEAIDKASITLGVNERFAPRDVTAVQVNTNSDEDNGNLQVEFK